MRRKTLLAVLVMLIGVLAFAAAGCGGEEEAPPAEAPPAEEAAPAAEFPPVAALPSALCSELEYGGEGEPTFLIASDLPMQGSSRTQTIQMVEAIRVVLEERGWKAGDYNVAYQVCDDSTAQAGKWDPGKCSQNANAYAQNESMIALIGTFNSGCAAIVIPVLNQAPGGGLAMVSPANTYVCLTEGGPGCDKTEPDKYYPTGTRNYARVVAHDAYQGAAVAEFAQGLGIKSCFVLNDKEAYGFGVANNFQNAAKAVGIEVAGFEAWDPRAASYEALFRKIGQSGADCVFFGGLIDENGAQLIKDKVAVLGPNVDDPAEGVVLLAPDGFTAQQTIDEAGVENAQGMFMSVAGVPIEEFTGPAVDFIEGLKPRLGGAPVDPYAIYGGQAARVVLDAIGRSDGTRADVINQLFATEVQLDLLGNFVLNENGDPAEASGAVVGFTIYKATDKLETFKVLSPKPETVEAARG